LFFGSNPRITNFVKEAARVFNWIEDDPMKPLDPAEYNRMFQYGLSIMGGFSNYYKMKQANDHGRYLSSTGKITDSQVSKGEAMMKLFGFPTMDETQLRITNDKLYAASQDFKDDVNEYWKTVKMTLAADGIANEDPEFAVRTLSLMTRSFASLSPEFAKELKRLMDRDIQNNDIAVFNRIIKAIGYVDNTTADSILSSYAPGEESQKERALLFLNELKDIKANHDERIREDR
jgi:hypothetical protein